MFKRVLNRVGLVNVMPKYISHGNLSGLVHPVEQLIFTAKPEHVDSVVIRMEGRDVLRVEPWKDDEGVKHTGGEMLAMLNRLEGLYLTGGHFSIRFGNMPLQCCRMGVSGHSEIAVTFNEKLSGDVVLVAVSAPVRF